MRPPKTNLAAQEPAAREPGAAAALSRLEFYRHALALMPAAGDPAPGFAFAIRDQRGDAVHVSCNCGQDRKKTCRHRKQLESLVHVRDASCDPFALDATFRGSMWYLLSQILAEACRLTPETVQLSRSQHDDGRPLRVEDAGGDPLLVYRGTGSNRRLFVERCLTVDPQELIPSRGRILKQLMLLTLSAEERVLAEKGMKTRRQAHEETFWFRFAYHGFRQFGLTGCRFAPMIEESSGTFFLEGMDNDRQRVFSIVLPRTKVKRVLAAVKNHAAQGCGLPIQPLPVDLLFDARLNAAMDLELRPVLQLIRKDGEARFFQRSDLRRFQYGDLYYLKELRLLVEDRGMVEVADTLKVTPCLVKASQVPAFIDAHAGLWESSALVLGDELRHLRIIKTVDRVKIVPGAMDRSWLWLSVTYEMANQGINLADLLKAKKTGQRYITTAGGWIDTLSEDLEMIHELAAQIGADPIQDSDGRVRLRRQDLYRLGPSDGRAPVIAGDGPGVKVLEGLLNLKAPLPMPVLSGLASALRGYQKMGTEWLSFLYENRLGGLLCDEMGLGKTHQVMALMVWLRQSGAAPDPFLVVCPTTVISHWEKKLAAHAPGLGVAVHHGGQRRGVDPFTDQDVVLTSYAILRIDADLFAQGHFAIAVFDEIQHVKNKQTQTFAAAAAIRADVKFGLTGTPVENSLADLKALMDLTLPGYLGTDEHFAALYRTPIEAQADTRRRARLNRLLYPFTLRRLKSAVLAELPPKIEDVLTCRLSPDQVKLYRAAIEGRAAGLLQVLDDPDAPIPYIHIFALLNLLKQICDHPALVVGKGKDANNENDLASGKWDLFTELLDQCLQGGQKVVVFSQYLAMLAIMQRHLERLGIGHAMLTGSSRKRGHIVARFNDDDNCRVFLGSLKAGGTGIDLVAATVVIHYDRWWNAAREDQATDRVHRFGQKNTVQVFKLITEGTLEEKIAAIVDNKRLLMEAAVKPDDPAILKSFTREDLIQLLRLPDC